MWYKGLKFGLLLQLAIGPMCVMVFNTAKESGFIKAFALVVAITLIDLLYITLAGVGVGAIISKPNIEKVIRALGAGVLAVFALNITLSGFQINLIPILTVYPSTSNIFLQGLILTLANPITIIFWGSVLTAKIIEDGLNKNEIIFFSLGCVTSTILFLSLIAGLGVIVSAFIPKIVSNMLNVIVGLILFFFAIRLIIGKSPKN